MFLKVRVPDSNTNTSNALNIVINLGTELSKAEDVIAMFENNVQYVREGYSEVELIKPAASIELGQTVEFSKSTYGHEETHVVVTASDDTVGFVKADNAAFINLAKVKANYKKTIEALKKELELSKKKNDILAAQLEDATAKGNESQ